MAKRLNGEIARPVFVIIVGILALLVVYFLPGLWMKKMESKGTGVVLLDKAKSPSSLERVEKETAAPSVREIKRDPFLPSYMRLESKRSGVFSSEELGFSLSGIMWDPEDPVAIINGEVMHVGDVINGKKILEIKKDRVVFGEGEARYTVTIWEQ